MLKARTLQAMSRKDDHYDLQRYHDHNYHANEAKYYELFNYYKYILYIYIVMYV